MWLLVREAAAALLAVVDTPIPRIVGVRNVLLTAMLRGTTVRCLPCQGLLKEPSLLLDVAVAWSCIIVVYLGGLVLLRRLGRLAGLLVWRQLVVMEILEGGQPVLVGLLLGIFGSQTLKAIPVVVTGLVFLWVYCIVVVAVEVRVRVHRAVRIFAQWVCVFLSSAIGDSGVLVLLVASAEQF